MDDHCVTIFEPSLPLLIDCTGYVWSEVGHWDNRVFYANNSKILIRGARFRGRLCPQAGRRRVLRTTKFLDRQVLHKCLPVTVAEAVTNLKKSLAQEVRQKRDISEHRRKG